MIRPPPAHARLGLCLALVLGACGRGTSGDGAGAVDAVPPADTVVLETTAGEIVIALENARAPITVENFLLHVRSGFYDGVVFHRVESGFVIQAGEVDLENRKRVSPVFPIQSEATNGLKNRRGTVAMARTGDPHSATSQFFINLSDNAKLDHRDASPAGFGYAVFGRVIAGMDAVDSIARIPTAPRRTYAHFPVVPVSITRARITSRRD